MFKKVKRRNRRYLRVAYSDDPLQDDTHMYRCNVCGFICNSKKVEVVDPRPNATNEETGIFLVADGNDFIPTVVKGCPKCGTLYSKRNNQGEV